MNRKVELLAPAGSMDKLKAAFRFGADAVYVGGKSGSLRAGAANFDSALLAEAVDFAHRIGRKIYYTLNIIAHNQDLAGIELPLKELDQLAVDGVIIADLGVFALARAILTKVPIHMSTQASIMNWRSVAFLQDQGVRRIILGRELSLEEIAEIRQRVPQIELEVFVHGAMCMAYSGRCHISHYLTGRDGNRGSCTNPCRWRYVLQEESRAGELFPLEEDERGTYFFYSRDLCAIDFLDKILALGIDSVKIEGRGKGLLYVATTTKVYRAAIDQYCADAEAFSVDPKWVQELKNYTHRGYTSGFYLGDLDRNATDLAGATFHPVQLAAQVVSVTQEGKQLLRAKNQLRLGADLELLRPVGEPLPVRVLAMWDPQTDQPIEVAQPNQLVITALQGDFQPDDLLRTCQSR